MIKYDTGGVNFFINVLQLEGSVFPKALMFSVPISILSAVFVALIHQYRVTGFDHFQDEESVMTNNAIWGGFSFLVGFLVVFRTSQAYNRFWEGCGAMHKMGAEWFDGASSLMAYTRYSSAEPEAVMNFQNLCVRLFSMLHAVAMGEIEESGDGTEYKETMAYNLHLIDPDSIDERTIQSVHDCDAKVELIFQWIQQIIVENIKTGVLNIPPPILSRSFQEIANGMVHFHEAMKISIVPFPFPYAQSCDTLLLIHWCLVPFVVSQWITKAWWAFLFSFIQVFTLWTLNLIAVELENPFGTDANDIDGGAMQNNMNNALRLLVSPESRELPAIRLDETSQQGIMHKAGDVSTFAQIWSNIVQGSEPTCRRFTSFGKGLRGERGPSRASMVGSASTASVSSSMSRYRSDAPDTAMHPVDRKSKASDGVYLPGEKRSDCDVAGRHVSQSLGPSSTTGADSEVRFSVADGPTATVLVMPPAPPTVLINRSRQPDLTPSTSTSENIVDEGQTKGVRNVGSGNAKLNDETESRVGQVMQVIDGWQERTWSDMQGDMMQMQANIPVTVVDPDLPMPVTGLA